MKRRIIKIDEEKCNGCGLCAKACHEGAIGMSGGKAKLLREDYCDGLGDCLPVCPTGAITFEEREAAAYDEQAVKAAAAGAVTCPSLERGEKTTAQAIFGNTAGCPGRNAHAIKRAAVESPAAETAEEQSELMQWPVQIKLAPPEAAYFDNAHLLVAADCAAYAYAGFHKKFMRNRVTLIGCPKLDAVDYAEKLGEIISRNNIKSVTVARMEVPCCGGIEQAVIRALKNSGKMIPWRVVTLSTDGKILDE